MTRDLPLLILAATVCAYWATVIGLAVHKRLRHGRGAGVWPRQRAERVLWLLIGPDVLAWIALPVLACADRASWLAPPAWAAEMPALALRWTAALMGVGCYLASLVCWRRMGRSWSMAVVPKEKVELVTSGPYRWVRHPIYALSILLMIASAAVLPIVPMLLLAAAHTLTLTLKARNEERYLTRQIGAAYLTYIASVGRFWPRWSSAAAPRSTAADHGSGQAPADHESRPAA